MIATCPTSVVATRAYEDENCTDIREHLLRFASHSSRALALPVE